MSTFPSRLEMCSAVWSSCGEGRKRKSLFWLSICIVVCFLSPAQWLITSLVFSPWTWSPPWLRSWAGIGLRLPGLPWLPCGELSRLSERHRKKKKSSVGAFQTQRWGIWTHRRSNYSFCRPLPLRGRQSGLSVFPSHWKTVPHPAQNRNLISMIHIFDLASALLALTDAILPIYPGLGPAIRIVLACASPRGKGETRGSA